MRMLALLSLTIALFGGAVSADMYVKTTQAEARAVENRWKNCSQIVNGRLGALHPDGDVSAPFAIQQYDPVSGFNVTYMPCYKGSGEYAAYVYLLNAYNPISFDVAENKARVVEFNMPEKKGDIPRFIGKYSRSGGSMVTVTTFCSSGSHNASVVKINGTDDYSVQLFSQEACPRFPYTNESVPAGGVAALVILILSFAVQFGICGWYHATHTLDENPADRKDEEAE